MNDKKKKKKKKERKEDNLWLTVGVNNNVTLYFMTSSLRLINKPHQIGPPDNLWSLICRYMLQITNFTTERYDACFS